MSDILDFMRELSKVLPFKVGSPEARTQKEVSPGVLHLRLPDGEGPDGEQGEEGLEGAVGPTGVGPTGAMGEAGPQGVDGDPAPGGPGPPGPMGAPGDIGDILDGFPGDDGPVGPTVPGDKGETGDPGPKGSNGPAGEDALGLITGPPGADAPGPPGEAGTPSTEPGLAGVPGSKGFRGPKGFKGEQGPKLAIVQVGRRNVGFHVQESPRCLWLDHVSVLVPRGCTRVSAAIDGLYVEMLDDREGLEILAVQLDDGSRADCEIAQGRIEVRCLRASSRERRVTVTIAGIGRHHCGRRFPIFTREQMERNAAFWASAYEEPGGL